ncbi:MAG: calcium-binding protein [Pseudomonadota bacterium]
MPNMAQKLKPKAGAVPIGATFKAGSGPYPLGESDGFDLILGHDGRNELFGDGADDIVFGLGGNDWINGLGGDDVLYGGDGDDRIFGWDGADDLFGGDGNDVLQPGEGPDYVDGGAGIDTLSFALERGAVTVDLKANVYHRDGGWSGRMVNVENVIGSSDDDTIIGNAASNTLEGGYGSDIIRGGAGNDTINGGMDVDHVWGDDGHDTFWFEQRHHVAGIDFIYDFDVSEDLIVWDAAHEDFTTVSASYRTIDGRSGMLLEFEETYGSISIEGTIMLVSDVRFTVPDANILII